MKCNSSKIKSYYFDLKKRTKFLPFALHFLGAVILAICLTFFGKIKLLSADFWIIFVTINLFLASQNTIYARLLKNHTDLTGLIANVASKSQVVTNPLPTTHKKTGFDEVLNFIYSTDIEEYQKPKPTISNPDNFIEKSKLGVCVFNSKNKLVFSSDFSPKLAEINPKKLEEITAWAEKSRKNKIKNSKVWERVSSVISDTDKQKIFDIYATYEKGSDNDLTLIFIDKTENYIHDENDLNFIAFAAHEIRGPITIIRGYLDILSAELEGFISDEQKELILRLIVSSNKLNSYVNNILNVAKFDQNRLELSTQEHTIGEILASISDDIESRALSQNRTLELTIPHDLPTVSVDISGISQVLINLIDNAIKYSNDGGKIRIFAENKDSSVDISVQDFGIGMPQNVLGNLFSKFYRSHRSRETVAGSGIGLYISKAITEMMGGRISVVSTEGKGSTFTLSLPHFSKNKLNSKKPVTKIINHGKVS